MRLFGRYNAVANGCGPVAVLVFKTSGRGDELRWWVRLPRVRATSRAGVYRFLMPDKARGTRQEAYRSLLLIFPSPRLFVPG